MVEHEHEWGEWEEVPVWYTSAGTFKGEFRKCKTCPRAESRNLEVIERPGVINPTIGIFARIFNQEGKLLIKKIETGRYAGEWDLPGGGVLAAAASKAPDERVLWEELNRQLKEEVGIEVSTISPESPEDLIIGSPAILKGGGDWAFPVGTENPIYAQPTKGEWKFVSPYELRELANGPEGNRLLSGWGKRMCRLCLRQFRYSPNSEYVSQANEMLREIETGG